MAHSSGQNRSYDRSWEEIERMLDVAEERVIEWQDWFDNQFIMIDEARIKRDILRWYSRHRYKSKNFFELQESANSLDEMVEAVWPPEENK